MKKAYGYKTPVHRFSIVYMARSYDEKPVKVRGELKKIFGGYAAHIDYLELDTIRIETKFTSIGVHVSKIRLWEEAFWYLYKSHYVCDHEDLFMMVRISDTNHDTQNNLKVFFDKYKNETAKLFGMNRRGVRGRNMLDFDGDIVGIKFVGTYDANVFSDMILTAYAIVQYCAFMSVEDIEQADWGDFQDFVNDELEYHILMRT